MKMSQESSTKCATSIEPCHDRRRAPVAPNEPVAVPLEPPGSRFKGPRLEAIVLLAGCVRSELADATGRSRLDLPLDGYGSVLNHWQRMMSQWMEAQSHDSCPLRVVVPRGSASPASGIQVAGVALQLEHDPHDCRGTGGLLRDLAAAYDDDQWLLVATAAQVLLEPLAPQVERLREIDGDVRMLAHADGTPVGLMLIRCGCLRLLEPVGFVDFKEQGLPRIARRHRVSIVMRRRPSGAPITTARDYLRALRWHHLRHENHHLSLDPFAEDWRCAFKVAETGSIIDESATLHDSVVLSGGRVGRDATLVRSIVCDGGVIARGQVVVDQIVLPRSRRTVA